MPEDQKLDISTLLWPTSLGLPLRVEVIITYQYQPSILGSLNLKRSGPLGPGISATASSSWCHPWRHSRCWNHAHHHPGNPDPQNTWLQWVGGAQHRLGGTDCGWTGQWNTGLWMTLHWSVGFRYQSNICFHSASPQQGWLLSPSQTRFSSKKAFQILWASVVWYHHYPTLKGRVSFPGQGSPLMPAG